jgi:DNA polymerase-3 subunit beta
MKVVCNRGALLEALNVTGSVIGPRTPKPVLQCVKLSAENNELTVSATDLEVAIQYRDSQVDISTAGGVVVQADSLRSIVRESMDDTLALELAGEMAVVRGNDAVFRIPTQSMDAFPPVPGFEGEVDFEVQGKLLRQLIAQTVFAAAKASTRYAFNGVLVIAKGKSITFVSTDGHRLAQARGELSKAAKGEKDGLRAIVPVKALSMIDRLIDNPEEGISFQVKENQVIVHTARATLTSTLVEGQFPPFEEVIPRDVDRKMEASAQAFLSAVRRASLIGVEESKGVRFKFAKSGVVLSSYSPSAGEATINFACKYTGPEFEIGFNPIYLMEALKVVTTEDVSFEMTAPNRPGLIRGGADFLYVIMPVNLQA